MKRTLALGAALALALTLTAPAGAINQTFHAQATGANEVPPVGSSAQVNVVFRVDRNAIHFEARGTGFSGPVWGAHLHMAPAGSNGPIKVSLCGDPGPAALASCNSDEGRLRLRGTIDNGLAAAWGTTIPSIIRGLFTQQLYVNFHTDAYPGGEARGQVRPVTN